MDEWKEETLKMITVLMASYNGSRYIRQQLDSILAQDEEDVRILVSDDCSSDGSRELLKEYEAGGPGAGAFTEGAVRRSSCPFPEAP
jgi:glycosyltransferase involved in cell wall biosynthesis